MFWVASIKGACAAPLGLARLGWLAGWLVANCFSTTEAKAKAVAMKEQVPEKKADLEEVLHRVYATLVVVLLEIANKMQLMIKGPSV